MKNEIDIHSLFKDERIPLEQIDKFEMTDEKFSKLIPSSMRIVMKDEKGYIRYSIYNSDNDVIFPFEYTIKNGQVIITKQYKPIVLPRKYFGESFKGESDKEYLQFLIYPSSDRSDLHIQLFPDVVENYGKGMKLSYHARFKSAVPNPMYESVSKTIESRGKIDDFVGFVISMINSRYDKPMKIAEDDKDIAVVFKTTSNYDGLLIRRFPTDHKDLAKLLRALNVKDETLKKLTSFFRYKNVSVERKYEITDSIGDEIDLKIDDSNPDDMIPSSTYRMVYKRGKFLPSFEIDIGKNELAYIVIAPRVTLSSSDTDIVDTKSTIKSLSRAFINVIAKRIPNEDKPAQSEFISLLSDYVYSDDFKPALFDMNKLLSNLKSAIEKGLSNLDC